MCPPSNRADTQVGPYDMDMYKQTLGIAQAVHDAGGRALIVGGYARDEIMRRQGQEVESKDIDLEVYGLGKPDLEKLLSKFGRVIKIGKQFEVFQVRGIDVALPRREQQVGTGHRDLQTECDPDLSFEDAFRRRDFTINAIGLDPLTDEVIDLYGGVQDIQGSLLRMVDPKTFADDPLRPLRAAQFAGRFGFVIEPETLAFARTVDMTSLPLTRIGEEWHKLLTLSEKPSVGLQAMLQIGVIKQLHPKLEAVVSDPTMLELMDRAATALDQNELSHIEIADRLLMVLCSVLDPVQVRAFLNQLEINQQRVNRILSVIGADVGKSVMSEAKIRHLSNNIYPASIKDLVWLMEIKSPGSGSELLKNAEQLGVAQSRPEPILTGDDLIELGFEESPELGQILNHIYQAQLDGEI
jgi:tRNA nucleotidyltransferase (CCA-adding enzyme)